MVCVIYRHRIHPMRPAIHVCCTNASCEGSDMLQFAAQARRSRHQLASGILRDSGMNGPRLTRTRRRNQPDIVHSWLFRPVNNLISYVTCTGSRACVLEPMCQDVDVTLLRHHDCTDISTRTHEYIDRQHAYSRRRTYSNDGLMLRLAIHRKRKEKRCTQNQ